MKVSIHIVILNDVKYNNNKYNKTEILGFIFWLLYE